MSIFRRMRLIKVVAGLACVYFVFSFIGNVLFGSGSDSDVTSLDEGDDVMKGDHLDWIYDDQDDINIDDIDVDINELLSDEEVRKIAKHNMDIFDTFEDTDGDHHIGIRNRVQKVKEELEKKGGTKGRQKGGRNKPKRSHENDILDVPISLKTDGTMHSYTLRSVVYTMLKEIHDMMRLIEQKMKLYQRSQHEPEAAKKMNVLLTHHTSLTREKLALSDLGHFGVVVDRSERDLGIAKKQVGEQKNKLAELFHKARKDIRNL